MKLIEKTIIERYKSRISYNSCQDPSSILIEKKIKVCDDFYFFFMKTYKLIFLTKPKKIASLLCVFINNWYRCNVLVEDLELVTVTPICNIGHYTITFYERVHLLFHLKQRARNSTLSCSNLWALKCCAGPLGQ